MSSEEAGASVAETEQLARRRGDRRLADIAVATDRRKGNRRSIPGLDALVRMLLRRKPAAESDADA